MAKISSYPKDLAILNNDAWIGTDSSNRSTKQFTAQAVANYLNINAKILIGAQMWYKFVTTTPTIGTLTGPANNDLFSSITSIVLSAEDLAKQQVKEFMDYLVGTEILINQQNAISTFGHYKLDSFTPNADGTFYTAVLTLKGSNGFIDQLSPNNIYSITSFNRDGDANETFTQKTSATSWSVTHTLNKKPAVSVVIGTEVAGGSPTTDDIEVYPEIEYTSNSALTIRFAAAQCGYAYLN